MIEHEKHDMLTFKDKYNISETRFNNLEILTNSLTKDEAINIGAKLSDDYTRAELNKESIKNLRKERNVAQKPRLIGNEKITVKIQS